MRTKVFSIIAILVLCVGADCVSAIAQTSDRLTPIQREIEKQRLRLNSQDVEERRDALMRLRNLHRPEASRAAAVGLNDATPSVRVAATHALASMSPDEAANLLLPLLQDKLEFVRREAAYALGETRSRSAVTALTNLLSTDKEASVRAAAAIALGEIRDESAVPALVQVLSGPPPSGGKKKKPKTVRDDFLLRSAARSLGQIRSAAGVDILIATLSNETNSADVRREAASALGSIGNLAAVPALRAALASDDPYVSEAASAALRRLHASKN